MEPSGMAAKAGPAVSTTICSRPVSAAVPRVVPGAGSPMVTDWGFTGTTIVPAFAVAVTASCAVSVPVAVPVNVEATLTVQELPLTIVVVVVPGAYAQVPPEAMVNGAVLGRARVKVNGVLVVLVTVTTCPINCTVAVGT